MTYCRVHKRALHPGGWYTPVRKHVEDSWVALTSDVWRWAMLMHLNFPTQVELREDRCDLCAPQSQGCTQRGEYLHNPSQARRA